MKKNRSMVHALVQATVCAFALSVVGCASQQVSQSSVEQDGNGVAQGSTESDFSGVKPKKDDERRVSPLVRVPHGRSKSP